MARFCSQCGAPLAEGAFFCSECGSAVTAPETNVKKPRHPSAEQQTPHGNRAGASITLCPDGKYRWIYEMSLLKNPTIILLIWKIFFFIVVGIFLFTVIMDAGNSDFWWDGFLNSAKIFGYILLGMTGLCLLGYLVYAAMMGGKYRVMFEMDERGVNHKQLPKQAKKAQAIASLTMMAGAVSGNLTTVGVGMNAARTEMYTEFEKVKRIKAYPRRNLLKVNCTIEHNQVYAEREDFAFVKDFILAHCPNAKR